jgi:hypothetical protein
MRRAGAEVDHEHRREALEDFAFHYFTGQKAVVIRESPRYDVVVSGGAISRMVMAGIDDYTIMELVGHLTKAMLAATRIPPSSGRSARSTRSRFRCAECGQNGNPPGGKRLVG